MLKNIVFDMGGVIIEWNPKKLSKIICPEHPEVLKDFLFDQKTWLKLDAGTISMEEGYQEIMDACEEDYKEIVSYAFYHWHDYIEIYEKTHQLIKKLKEKGYRVFLLSNCSVAFDEYSKKYAVFSLFESCYVSAKHQKTKPNPDIYLDFLVENNLKAEESIFIDDVLVNVEGAKAAGMEGFHFTQNYDELEAILL